MVIRDIPTGLTCEVTEWSDDEERLKKVIRARPMDRQTDIAQTIVRHLPVDLTKLTFRIFLVSYFFNFIEVHYS